jgi:hypothetical protein
MLDGNGHPFVYGHWLDFPKAYNFLRFPSSSLLLGRTCHLSGQVIGQDHHVFASQPGQLFLIYFPVWKNCFLLLFFTYFPRLQSSLAI